MLALARLLRADTSPFAPKPTDFPAKARRIIYLVMNGGMSHVDTFDPKPMLSKYNGKPMPGGAVNHLGIQVKSTDIVMAMKDRFAAAGFKSLIVPVRSIVRTPSTTVLKIASRSARSRRNSTTVFASRA